MTPEQFAGYMALEKAEDMMKHKMGHERFEHKDGFGKDGDKADKDHDANDQD
jgi:hypothetical protein